MYKVIQETGTLLLEAAMNEAEENGFKLEVLKVAYNEDMKVNEYIAIMHKE